MIEIPIHKDWEAVQFAPGVFKIGDLLRADPNWEGWENYYLSATEVAQVADLSEVMDRHEPNVIMTIYALRAIDRLPIRRFFWRVVAESRILRYTGQLGVYL